MKFNTQRKGRNVENGRRFVGWEEPAAKLSPFVFEIATKGTVRNPQNRADRVKMRTATAK